MVQTMNAESWYWVLRFLLGVGVLVAIFVGLVFAAGGPAAVTEDLNEPMTGGDFVAAIAGVPLGVFMDAVFGAGLASYIVWGDWRVGIISPSLYTPEPRVIFR